MRILGIRGPPLVPLVQHNVMSLVDPSPLYTLLTQRTHNHLSMLVSGELIARAGNAPIEVSLVMEDSTAARTPAHEVDSTYTWGLGILELLSAGRGIQNAQIDLAPRVLITSYHHTRTIHV